MNLYWILLAVALAATDTETAIDRYIAQLLKSGFTLKQLQASGLRVEKFTTTVLPTTDLSTTTLSTTTEYSTVITSSDVLVYSTSTLPSTSVEYSTSTEYFATTEYSTTPEYTTTFEYSTTPEYSTVTEAITEEVSEEVTEKVSTFSDDVSANISKVIHPVLPTTALSAEIVLNKSYTKEGEFSNDSDVSIQLIGSTESSISVDEYSHSENSVMFDNCTQLADLGEYIQGSSTEANQSHSGLSWLLQDWLPNWSDMATFSDIGSPMLPSTELGKVSDSQQAEIESEVLLLDREVPALVAPAGLPLHREPLFLILLTAVVLILGKKPQLLLNT